MICILGGGAGWGGKECSGAVEWRRGVWYIRRFLVTKILGWRFSGMGRFERRIPGNLSMDEQYGKS